MVSDTYIEQGVTKYKYHNVIIIFYVQHCHHWINIIIWVILAINFIRVGNNSLHSSTMKRMVNIIIICKCALSTANIYYRDINSY